MLWWGNVMVNVCGPIFRVLSVSHCLVVLRCRSPVRQRLVSRQQQAERAEQREAQSTLSGQDLAQSGRQPGQAAGSVSRVVSPADHVCQVCPFLLNGAAHDASIKSWWTWQAIRSESATSARFDTVPQSSKITGILHLHFCADKLELRRCQRLYLSRVTSFQNKK